jgi:ABC-type branched-subunit amino acid transport system substrate-binding protein
VFQTYPNVVDAANAAAIGVNKKCELGRPLKILVCDEGFNVDKATTCARDAIDKKAIAQVGQSNFGDAIMPLYEAAGIPVLTSGNAAAYLTSKYFFPTTNLVPLILSGAPATQAVGATKFALVSVDIAATATFAPLLKVSLKAIGMGNAGEVRIPPDAVDMAPYAAQLVSSGADGFITALPDVLVVALLKALKQQGVDLTKQIRYCGGYTTVSQHLVDKLKADGIDMNGVLVTGSYWPSTDTTNKGVQQYLAEQKANGTLDSTHDNWSGATWTAVHVIAQALTKDKATTVDGASVFKALNNLGPYQSDFSAPFDYSTPAFTDPPLSTLRIFGRAWVLSEVKNGVITPITKSWDLDPLTKLDPAKMKP